MANERDPEGNMLCPVSREVFAIDLPRSCATAGPRHLSSPFKPWNQ